MAWLWLEPLLSSWLIVRTIDVLYVAWFVALFVFQFWASWSKDRILRQQALVAYLLTAIGVGTIAAALVASAGPCYYAQVVDGADPYAGLLSRLDSFEPVHQQLVARNIQRSLWNLFHSDQWGQLAGMSAMPSLHVSFAVLFALVAWQRSRVAGTTMGLYAVVIQVGSRAAPVVPVGQRRAWLRTVASPTDRAHLMARNAAT